MYRHKTTCVQKETALVVQDETNGLHALIVQLMQQNAELMEFLTEERKQNAELRAEILKSQQKSEENHKELMEKISNQAPRTIKNTINFNLYLDTECKDAINLSQFREELEVTEEEVAKIDRIGFVDGITEIIANRLNPIDARKRPIHYKRPHFFVKDNDRWEKDEDNRKMDLLINHTANRSFRTMHRTLTPEVLMSTYTGRDQESTLKLIRALSCGDPKKNEKNNDAIRKAVSKQVGAKELVQ